jgi:hypothetical protein
MRTYSRPGARFMQCPITGIGEKRLVLAVLLGAFLLYVAFFPVFRNSNSSVTPVDCLSHELPCPSPQPSPSQWEIDMGKSPLRLIVSRSWHSQESFTDHLECGHSLYVAVRPFEWRDGRLVNLPVTAKRRRCQQCAEDDLACAKNSLTPKKPSSGLVSP